MSELKLAVAWFDDLIKSKLSFTEYGDLTPYIRASNKSQKKQLINKIVSNTFESAMKLVMEKDFEGFADDVNKPWTIKFRQEKKFRTLVLKELNKSGYFIISMNYR
jgi:hypothetical protein